MSSLCQRLCLVLASVLTLTTLSSCTEGSLARMHYVRTGAIGIGPTGIRPGDRMLPHIKPESAEEKQINLAIRRGVEKALSNSRSFDYIPFRKMKGVPAHLNPTNQRAEAKQFALTNNLNAVIRVWALPSFHDGSVSVGFLVQRRDGKFVASTNTMSPSTVHLTDGPADPNSLATWEKTAFVAMKKALTKVHGL